MQVSFFFFLRRKFYALLTWDQRHVPKINSLFISIGLAPLQGIPFITWSLYLPSPISSSYTPHLAVCQPTIMSYLKLSEQITLSSLPRRPSPTSAPLPCLPPGLPLPPYHSLPPACSPCSAFAHTRCILICVMMEKEGREGLSPSCPELQTWYLTTNSA